MTEMLALDGAAGMIEARLDRPTTPVTGGAVLCHPHPLYGGSMHDAVLDTVATVLLAAGIACLRFNFRGVGASAGRFDNGDGEADDLAAIATAARDLLPGQPLWLVGYSFGAFVAWAATGRIAPAHLVLVAPPVGMMTFSGDPPGGCALDVIVGDGDDFAPVDQVNSWAHSLRRPGSVHVLAGTDHFFSGAQGALADTIGRLA